MEGETEKPTDAYRVSTYEARPTPSVTTGKITAVKKVNGTWLIWFNGQEAYCCTHGAKGTPNGCPVYNYSHTSIVSAEQYTPGDHYGNQINIWGGLGQLSLGLMSADATSETAYDEVQRWIIANYPDSTAARSYLSSIAKMHSGVSTFAAESDYYSYVYQPSVAGWQTITLIGPPTGSIDPDVPTDRNARDANGEIPADQPRRDFVHWLVWDIAPTVTGVQKGEASVGDEKSGKRFAKPIGVEAINDYSSADEVHRGYDGPCPPGFDARLHGYEFRVYALDVESLNLPDTTRWAEVSVKMAPHVIGMASIQGIYSLNPRLQK